MGGKKGERGVRFREGQRFQGVAPSPMSPTEKGIEARTVFPIRVRDVQVQLHNKLEKVGVAEVVRDLEGVLPLAGRYLKEGGQAKGIIGGGLVKWDEWCCPLEFGKKYGG